MILVVCSESIIWITYYLVVVLRVVGARTTVQHRYLSMPILSM